MVKASEKKREIFDFFKDNADKLFDDNELVKSTKELVTLFGKVIRGYRLYPRTNPAFSRFADQFKVKLDEILSDIPSISLRISTKGFMLGSHVLETGEKDREVVFFLYNDGLREIFFQKGTQKDEIWQFFDILAQCTLFANEDYDLSTLLWDHNFTNIGYITEDELIKQNLSISNDADNFSPFLVEELSYGPGFDGIGEIDNEGKEGAGNSPQDMANAPKFESSDFEKYSELMMKEEREIDFNERKELLNQRLSNYIVGKMEMFKFDEALKRNSDSFVVNRFLKELSSRLMSSQGTKAGKELLDTAVSLWEKLLLFGSVSGAILFIQTLKTIAEQLQHTQPEYAKKIRDTFADLENEEFLSDFFFTIEDIPAEEIAVIGKLFAMVPAKKMEFLLSKINSIDSKDTRIAIIHSCSEHMPITDDLLALTRHSDWKVVRNALAMMKDKKDPRILPAIRATVSHPQKQARIEALALLMEFSVEEALPALERAVFSSARDVRSAAIQKILELKDNTAIKPIINRLLQVHNLKKLENDEIDEIFQMIISLRRYDLFDLLGQQLLTEDPEIRMKAIQAIQKATTMSHFEKFIIRAADINSLSKMKTDELQAFCKLLKPEIFPELFPAVKNMLSASGSLFNKSVPTAKEEFYKAIFYYRNDPEAKKFIEKSLSSGNKETVKIVNKIKDKYL
jgi:hypothetical protein